MGCCRRRIGSLVLSLGAFVVLGLAGCADLRGFEPDIRNHIRAQFVHRRAFLAWFRRAHEPAMVDNRDIAPLVQRFYRARHWEPAWTGAKGPNGDAQALANVLSHAGDEGLDPEQYQSQVIDRSLDSLKGSWLKPRATPAQLADLDVLLTRSFFKYAVHLYGGQVDPGMLPAEWHIQVRSTDYVGVLNRAVEHHNVAGALASLAPQVPDYAALRKALADFRRVQQSGGWPSIPPGPPLRPGHADPRVPLLRARLIASGDLDPSARTGPVYDEAVAAGVRHFQVRQGLDPTGQVGRGELAQLDLPVMHRIRQIELNMERRRWVPPFPSDRYIEVNIPAFTLRVSEHGHDVMAMRVVVGKELLPTPVFADEITYLVINPQWNVPPTIASKEVLPELQKDPTYLSRNHMRLFDGDRELDATTIDWASVDPTHFPYTVRQDPGSDNALGHLKFMLPNKFDIYLHDTPANALFNAKERDLSHGCVRVERPLDLATYLMQGTPWDRGAFEAAFDTASNHPVKLPRPEPVFILYWTAWVDGNGVQFRDDVYGLDSLLDQVLRKGTQSRLQAFVPERTHARSFTANSRNHDLLESPVAVHLAVLPVRRSRRRARARLRCLRRARVASARLRRAC